MIFHYICSYIPMVPRPPNLKTPKRVNGTLRVVISGVTLRIATASEGFPSGFLDAILLDVVKYLSPPELLFSVNSDREARRISRREALPQESACGQERRGNEIIIRTT